MNTYKLKTSARTLISLTAIMGMGMSSQAYSDENMPILIDSSNSVVVDSSGDCVLTAGGRNAIAPECGLVLVIEKKPSPKDSDGDGVLDGKDQCPNTPRGAPVDAKGCALDSDGDGVPDYKDKCPNTRPGAKVDMNGCEIIGNITINLVNDEFDFDSASLKPAMQSALNDVASRVNASTGDERLQIIGHTDSTGPEAYNDGLSRRRAQSVANYLVGRGISAGKMSTSGMGESQPIADNGTSAGRARNRRAEIRTR